MEKVMPFATSKMKT